MTIILLYYSHVNRQTKRFGVRAQKVAIAGFMRAMDFYNTITYSVYCRLYKG